MESVAIVDLYYRSVNGTVADLDEEKALLSQRLNIRADKLNIEHDEKFRNINGMNMIFENVRYVATNGKRRVILCKSDDTRYG